MTVWKPGLWGGYGREISVARHPFLFWLPVCVLFAPPRTHFLRSPEFARGSKLPWFSSGRAAFFGLENSGSRYSAQGASGPRRLATCIPGPWPRAGHTCAIAGYAARACLRVRMCARCLSAPVVCRGRYDLLHGVQVEGGRRSARQGEGLQGRDLQGRG